MRAEPRQSFGQFTPIRMEVRNRDSRDHEVLVEVERVHDLVAGLAIPVGALQIRVTRQVRPRFPRIVGDGTLGDSDGLFDLPCEEREGAIRRADEPSAVTHGEMASAIGAAIGRSVTFVDVPPAAFSAAVLSAGLPAWQVEGLIEDYAHYARGEAAVVSPAVRRLPVGTLAM